QPANSINVKDYGATGNGSTDDTASLLAAFNAAVAQGKTAWVPSGTYKVSTMTFPKNVSVSGEGTQSFINGKILMNTGDDLTDMKMGVAGQSIGIVGGVPVTGLNVDRVHFIGGGGTNDSDMIHVFSIQMEALNSSTFTDCTIETNLGGWGNGIAITDNGVTNGTLHDVTFLRLHIMPQPRMGFEMLGRSYMGARTLDYYNIIIKDSVIEPTGSEAISFDGPGHDLRVEGSLFKGSGTAGSYYPWHQALEFNGSTSSYALNNTFYRSDGVWLNMHCTGCTFDGNYFDNSVNNIGVTTTNNGDPTGWGGRCTNCTFQNNQMILDKGGNFLYLDNSDGIASTNNQFNNNTFWNKNNPTTNCAIYLYNGSTMTMQGNKFYYKYQFYSDNHLCTDLRDGSTLSDLSNGYYSPSITPAISPPPIPTLNY
ncbi:MAG: glycoside hydrolase family 55 protein, partial [Prolixibacteraceae bacterium]|nr:glycoside hydrolase family 55 protein [Prolixibacteraceae bacterium]